MNKDLSKPNPPKETGQKSSDLKPAEVDEVHAAEAKSVASQPTEAKPSVPKDPKRSSKNLEQIKAGLPLLIVSF